MKSLIDYTPAPSSDWAYLDRFFALLSEENLTVRRANVPTGSIDLQSRIITIPNFATDDKDIFLLMGSHEVSHALHTPPNWCHDEIGKVKNALLRDCLNIVEDIRIERLIRRKFPGFVPVYVRAYKKLLSNNFFSTNKWSDFKIHDKVNAYAKLGSSLDQPMTDRDMAVYRLVSDVKTFSDVIVKAKFLYDLVKAEESVTKGRTASNIADDLISELMDKMLKSDDRDSRDSSDEFENISSVDELNSIMGSEESSDEESLSKTDAEIRKAEDAATDNMFSPQYVEVKSSSTYSSVAPWLKSSGSGLNVNLGDYLTSTY